MPLKQKAILVIKVFLISGLIAVVLANLYPSEQSIPHQIVEPPVVGSPEFNQALGHLLGPPLLTGNKIESFYNGIEIFPAMLEAIQSAKKSITFEAYIYWSDEIGQKFINALIERANAGVKIHLLVDWMGSRNFKNEYLEKLRAAGIEIELYRPLSFANLLRMNNRTHRRILVVDGKVGFTGGVGISNDWDGNGDIPEKWRDTQYRIEGPVVNSLQSAFMDNWLKVREKVLHGPDYFPIVEKAGDSIAQVFKSSPEFGGESVRLMYQLAISSARKSINLSSAYFLPDELFIKELIKARERGVKIQIIVPGPHSDTHIVKKASRAHWGELLKAGIEIYEFQPARYHCKILIVDELFVSVGSTNFDNRSFTHNDESNLNLIDAAFAASESMAFEKDKSLSRQVTYEDWKSRTDDEKFLEFIAGLFKSQL